MEIAAAIVIGFYCVGLLVFTLTWKSSKGSDLKAGTDIKLSVIIPVRNEEENIQKLLNDLNHQLYPQKNYEVIVVDDDSDDGTINEVEKFNGASDLNIRLVRQTNDQTYPTPKKKAITNGVKAASGDVIVTTDGDCRVNPGWLSSIAQQFDSQDTQFISGPVVFDRGTNFFEKLQTMEFASLIGVGASSMELGYPNICNGANLAFRKDSFLNLNGYNGNGHIASGDDEFLLQKFAAKYKKGIRFLKDENAIVKTTAKRNFNEFYHQRKRWTSKLKHHKEWHIKFLSLGILLVNLALIASLAAALAGYFQWSWFAAIALIKFAFETLFLSQVLRFFDRSINWIGLVVLEIIHPIYIILFGIMTNFGTFSWKGRTYRE